MKFRFDDQPHQAMAIESVIDLFEGALLLPSHAIAGQAPGAAGHKSFHLSRDLLTENLKEVTAREGVGTQDQLLQMSETDLREQNREFPNFSVEMETGTGKTYVYIATALRLAETHGLRKFIILVHSVAIRAGVIKTFEQTADHFKSKFPNLSYKWGILGESRALEDFVDSSSAVQFLVSSIQLLDKPDMNTLYSLPEQPRIWGTSGSGIEQIAQSHPVVLIDEPQNMATPLRRRAIATLNPLLVLRYSATHKEPYNLVHRLGAKKAVDIGLVKRVAVKGVVAGSNGQPYLNLKKIINKNKKLFAILTIDRADKNGTQRTEITAQAGVDLFKESGQLPQYRGLIVDNILRKPDQVVFNEKLTLNVGQESGVDQLAIWRDQVRHTIRAHLARQAVIDAANENAKVLSLFFVERVADYAGGKAILPDIFDAIFCEEWNRANFPANKMPVPAELRVGYFPSTKTGILKDTKGGLASDAELEARAYREIIEHKELLLDRSNPRAFIFSHSALREGWDNPNVFQIGFLRHTRSDTERRQQIGRGLRLPVDNMGNRIMDPAINRLTLVVDESFAEFREGLNAEYIAAGGKADIPETEDADSEIIIRRRPKMFQSSEFKELWNRIRYKAVYRVSVDTPSLIASVAVSEHLNDLKYLTRRANVVQSAELIYNDKGMVVTEDASVNEGMGEAIDLIGQRLPNVVRLVEDQLLHGKFPLHLTRPTVVAVLKAVPDEFKAGAVDDPDRWARVMAQAIRVVLVEQMVENITYEPMDESTWWDANVVFLEVESRSVPKAEVGKSIPNSGVFPAPVGGINLFDHVDYDSHVERVFSSQLENGSDQIKLFAKLPRRFKVKTPVGEYSPDWAIVCNENGTDRLYLVRETKDTLNLSDLEWDEAMRIRFARKHFDAAPNGAVDFNHTTDKDRLRIGKKIV